MVLYGIVVILVCMQGWKERIFKLVQCARNNRLVQWFEGKDVSMQYLIRFIVLLIPILFWNVWNICCFDSFEINDTSARYLLSALVQGQAAIIAVIVTLTLVAVQIIASTYSPRVIDIFKENTVMWRLLVLYGLSIFFGLFVLEMIDGEYQNLSHWGVSLEFCVFLACLMGVAAFAGLFWHIGNVINLLKLKSILKKLSDEITKENISKYIKSVEYPKENRTILREEDPGQPIMDIIHSSIMKYDIAATRDGLEAVRGRVIEIIDSNVEKEISGYFCDHLERVCRLTVSKMDEESTVEVIRNLCIFGTSTAEKGLKNAVCGVVESIGRVGRTAAESGLEDAAREVAESLGMIGYYTVRFKEEQICIEKTGQVVKSLTSIGEIAAKNRFEFAVLQAAQFLEFIGTDAMQRYRLENSVLLENVALQAAQSLAKLTNLSKYVKEVIKCPKPTLSKYEQDCDRQSFMKLYKQELEKSRTKVSK